MSSCTSSSKLYSFPRKGCFLFLSAGTRSSHCSAVVLSTCNRTELYIARPAHDASPHDEMCRFLAAFSNVSAKDIAGRTDFRQTVTVTPETHR